MATKIATPVTQGGQNIGGVKSQAADVQYQKFDTNKDMFGAVEAEQFATIGNAIVSGASEIRDAAIAEDKLIQFSMVQKPTRTLTIFRML